MAANMDNQQIADLLYEIRAQTEHLEKISASVGNHSSLSGGSNSGNRDIRELGANTRTASNNLGDLGDESRDAARTMSAVASAAGKTAMEIGGFMTTMGRQSVNVSSDLNKLSPVVTAMGKAASATTDLLGDTAYGLSALATALPALSLGLAAIGGVAKVFSKGAEKAADAVNWYISTLQDMSTHYSTISSAGATAADGLTGVTLKANKLMIGMSSLAQISSSYGKDLALVYGNTARGLGNIADASDSLGKGTREHLMAMGIQLEEQAESIAAYSRVHVWSGRREKLTYEQLASAAKGFILEADEFSKMNGVSHKEAQDKIAAEYARVQFGAIVSDLGDRGKGVASAVASAETKFGPEFAHLLREAIGGYFTGSGNSVMTSLLGDAMLKYGDQVRNGDMTGDKFLELILKEMTVVGDRLQIGQAERKIGASSSPEMQQLMLLFRRLQQTDTDIEAARAAAKAGQQVNDTASKNLASAQYSTAETLQMFNTAFMETLPKASGVISAVANTLKNTVADFKSGIDYFIEKFGLEKEDLSSEEHRRKGTGNYSPGNLGQPEPSQNSGSVWKKFGGDSPAQQLSSLISSGESTTLGKFASPYDVPFNHGKDLMPPKPLTEMTLPEVLDYQAGLRNATRGKIGKGANVGTSAVGKYQFIQPTLEGLMSKLKASGVDISTAKFDAKMQDQLFVQHLGRDWTDFISGKIDDPKFLAAKISREWEAFGPKFPDRMNQLPGQLRSIRGYKKGGVASGPSGGYLELLHGTEAVVPLPDGNSIPVSMAGPTSSAYSSMPSPKVEIDSAKPMVLQMPELRELNAHMTEQMGAMQVQISRLSEVVDILRRSMSVNEQILQAARN